MAHPTLSGLHHVTLPVSDLQASTDWYETALRAERVPRMDHRDSAGVRFAVVLQLPGATVPVKLWQLPEAAAAVRGYDPVTFSVNDVAELDRWVAHLDACGIAHSPVTTARVGHSVTIADPDGTALRIYTDPAAGLDVVAFTEAAGPQ